MRRGKREDSGMGRWASEKIKRLRGTWKQISQWKYLGAVKDKMRTGILCVQSEADVLSGSKPLLHTTIFSELPLFSKSFGLNGIKELSSVPYLD